MTNYMQTAYTYDAFGRVKTMDNPTGQTIFLYEEETTGSTTKNWKLSDTRTSFIINRGYTMHEHLKEFGLINMNGRMYDPLLARFLSPDPYVQAPDFSQSFNRYAYCFNNPMKYTDPDGNNPLIILGLIAGAYMGGVYANNGQFKPSKWNYSLNSSTYYYMLLGGVWGALSSSIGGGIATSGIPMANTASIAAASLTYSIGNYVGPGGQTPISMSFGIVSYDFYNKKWGYLWDKNNKWNEYLGYSLGAMSNLKDINDIINSTAARVYTQKQYPQDDGGGKDYKISHTSVVKEGTGTFSYKGDNLFNKDGILMSYGPNSGAKLPGFIGFAVEPKLSTPLYATYPDLSLKSDILSLNKYLFSGLRAVSKYSLYQGFSSNCVNWASLGLWLNGIPNIGIHPFLLHGSLTVYNTGIYNMLSYQLLYK